MHEKSNIKDNKASFCNLNSNEKPAALIEVAILTLMAPQQIRSMHHRQPSSEKPF
jgi:hypothetical protein